MSIHYFKDPSDTCELKNEMKDRALSSFSFLDGNLGGTIRNWTDLVFVIATACHSSVRQICQFKFLLI